MEILISPAYSTVDDLVCLWREVRRNLLSFLASVPEAVFNTPVGSGWTLAQTVEHLYLAQLPVGVVIKKKLKDKPGDILTLPDYHAMLQTILNTKGLPNPAIVTPTHHYDRSELLSLLETAENKMAKYLAGLEKKELLPRTIEHPLAGTVNLFDWLWIMALHEYHHLLLLKEKFNQ